MAHLLEILYRGRTLSLGCALREEQVSISTEHVNTFDPANRDVRLCHGVAGTVVAVSHVCWQQGIREGAMSKTYLGVALSRVTMHERQLWGVYKDFESSCTTWISKNKDL